MTIFRPCIDIHAGAVKQIVGGTLTSSTSSSTSSDTTLITNYTSPLPPSHFAHLYRTHNLLGAHVILLGPNCESAALDALTSYPNRLQIGGGINGTNALTWIEKGAEKVIVTSYLFLDGKFSMERLIEVEGIVGRDRLVVDLSCRKKEDRWVVAMNKWQTLTDTDVNEETLNLLSSHCSEFLIHAADVEGLCRGIDEDLVTALGKWVTIPTTYAGGAKSLDDLDLVKKLSNGKVDLTFGSALDIFGGDKVKFEDCVEWNKRSSS